MNGPVIEDMATDEGPIKRVAPTRLEEVAKSRGIVALTVDTPASSRFTPVDPTRPKARWRTPEFMFYAIMFILVLPVMVWTPYTLSRPSHPNFAKYAHKISPGWLFGRGVDNSDAQYRSFRSNISALIHLSGGHLLLSFLYNYVFPPQDGNNFRRVPFHVGFGILMLLGLHGSSALKVLVIISLNYVLAKKTPSWGILGPSFGWAFNITILFLNYWFEGYHFEDLHPMLRPLDDIEGAYPRWHVSFNITMLRLVSFYMDYYWAIGSPRYPLNDRPNEKQRLANHHSEDTYNYANYLAYVLYAPLYIAGPIMTFNDFVWQLHYPNPLPRLSQLRYALRFLACFLTMELVLHFMYVVAIKDANAWLGDTPFEWSMIGFWNLIIVWLKLLIPWRFFRLWALIEGTDPPENMVRCMANNYSTLGFWRSWHRSYNLWLLRYIYIPCGGSSNVFLATLLVFTFVALWHDLSLKLLVWGWLLSVFVLPELTARWIFPASKFSGKWYYRHLCAFGGVLNILMMMTANLIGFVIGLNGLRYMLDHILGTYQGIQFLLFACVCLFVAVQVMFEYREEEMRQGMFRKC